VNVDDLLARPDEQRLREYKYRFSQSVVFGLPVIALQYFGRRLGPIDADRWVSLLQALLAGWVVYVNLGMLFEGMLLLRQRVHGRMTADLFVAGAALLIYIVSLVSAVRGIVASRLWYALAFHACVLILAAWTGVRWWQLARRVRRCA
jgi:cation transport ATPase